MHHLREEPSLDVAYTCTRPINMADGALGTKRGCARHLGADASKHERG